MQTEVQVERLMVTSLHRAIEQHAPEEIEVFKKWFDPESRQTQFHVAPLIGAVGYLRRKPDVYERVIEAAGAVASARVYEALSEIERRLLRAMPRFGRERLVKHLLHNGLRGIHRDAQLSVKSEDSRTILVVPNSVFCLTPAEQSSAQTRCHFYASLFRGLLERAEIACSEVEEIACRGQGDDACRFEVIP